MPEKRTLERARRKARAGKSPTTQAGEFVREEIHHVREGKHGARSPKQAIAIGLSKARRAGVKLPPPPGSQAVRKARHGKRRRPQSRPSARRGRSIARALRREPRGTTSRRALARQTHHAAQRRGSGSRHAAATKAVRTKGRKGLRSAARKAAKHARDDASMTFGSRSAQELPEETPRVPGKPPAPERPPMPGHEPIEDPPKPGSPAPVPPQEPPPGYVQAREA